MKHRPLWLNKKLNIRNNDKMKKMLANLKLNTICSEALCPNISECYIKNQATFLILGKICTRNCIFCNVSKGIPINPDMDEPDRVVQAVKLLNLKHVVITSPTRDDLSDGGAKMFVKTISALRKYSAILTVEILIPDFNGNPESIKSIVQEKPDITGHNLETVRRLYEIRKGADYERSLNVLKKIKEYDPAAKTKSAIMLGLGETEHEVIEFMKDLLEVSVRYLAITQYLAPGKFHYPVQKYVHPEKFAEYKEKALSIGFNHVESGPYVRSSYHAEEYLKM